MRNTGRGAAVARFLVLGVAAVLALLPILWTVSTSFKTQVDAQSYPPRLIPEHPTGANYASLFASAEFVSALATTAVVAAAATVLVLCVAYLCAYALVRMRPYGRRPLILMVTFAQTVPGIVFVVPLYSLSLRLGLYDTRVLLVLVYAGFLTPFATLILASFIRSLPVEVEEAALVDGCGRLGVVTRIVLPMTRPGLASAAVFTGLYAWNEFLIPVILGDQVARPLTVYVASFVTQKTIQWGPLTAAVSVVLIPVVVVVLCLQRRLVAGLAAGATKG